EGTNEGAKITTLKINIIYQQHKSNNRFRVRHHYLKNPAYGWVFAFLRLMNSPVTTLWSHPRKPVPAVFHGA
ncbi:hypothetical protein, partial [Enterobacter ludwigii]